MTGRSSHRIEWIAACVVLALLAIFAVPWGHIFGSNRSVAAYCQTWEKEGAKLRARYAGTGDDFVTATVKLMGAPDDLAGFFDKLAKVSPEDIQPDVERYRDAWHEIADSYKHGGLFDMLMTQAAVAAQVKGVESRIDNWTKTNCTTSAN